MPTYDAYIRVSRVGGREGESYRSPTEQRAVIKRKIKDLSATVGEVVAEEDVSGGKAVKDRALEGLIRRAEDGQSDGIVIENVSRFGRSAVENLMASRRLIEADARLVGAVDGTDLDPADPDALATAEMLFGVQSLMADNSRKAIKARWGRVIDGAVSSGIHVTGRVPVGYARSENRRLELDPVSAPVVEQAFHMRAGGATADAVAAYIRESLGRRFSQQAVARMITNRVYLGEARASRKAELVKKDAHDAIVTPELWAAAQRKAGTTFLRSGCLTDQARLNKLVWCASCGGPMCIGTCGVNRGAAYRCDDKSGDCQARASIACARLDDYVVNALNQHIEGEFAELTKKTGSKAKASDALNETRSAEHVRYQAAKDAVAKAESAVSEWQAAAADIIAESGQAAYRETLAALTKNVSELQAALYETPAPEDDAALVWLDGKPYAYEVYGENVEADRRMFRRNIKKVTVAKANHRGRHQPTDERVAIEWIG